MTDFPLAELPLNLVVSAAGAACNEFARTLAPGIDVPWADMPPCPHCQTKLEPSMLALDSSDELTEILNENLDIVDPRMRPIFQALMIHVEYCAAIADA